MTDAHADAIAEAVKAARKDEREACFQIADRQSKILERRRKRQQKEQGKLSVFPTEETINAVRTVRDFIKERRKSRWAK